MSKPERQPADTHARDCDSVGDEAARAEVERARELLRVEPRNAEAYRQLGAALRKLGDHEAAGKAELAAIEASAYDPRINRAGHALLANDLPSAEAMLRSILERTPNDAAVLRMLGEVALRTGHLNDAEALLRRALALAPGFEFARSTLAAVLHSQNRSGEALAELDRITAYNDDTLSLRAGVLSRVGGYEEAAELYRDLLTRHPEMPELWISLAHLLKIFGESDETAAAYRRVIELLPAHGEAWWSLANLKTFRFTSADIAAMEEALGQKGLSDDERFRLHFALGKAFEDLGKDAKSFQNYRKGNAIRAMQLRYEPSRTTALVDEMERLFTREFMDRHAGQGSPAKDPIFILGMPRAGSTLVEQILASHPLIEGTAELPDIIVLARALEEGTGTPPNEGWRSYPGLLADMSPERLRELGDIYIERTRVQRKTDRPLFTDKMPNNWIHLGLIRLILPNAKIVDVRRHPLASGFSNFKQHFARGQEFSYDLGHFGQYYRDYVRLMAHFDRVSPGAVHRVVYERLVSDPEAEVERLLAYLDVPFDPACLRFYETKRPIRTASSEQVRQPINRSSADHWRRFERWLGPLKRALGPALETWDKS